MRRFHDTMRKRKLYLFVASQTWLVPLALAGNWTYTPRLQIAETYTDNITLAPEGEEESDFVTEINPGISIRGAGRRVNATLDYRLQSLFYAKDSDRNDTFHQLQGETNVELLRERFFVDADARVGQVNRFNTGRVARDNLSVTNNRTDVVTYRVSPYWRERFGGYADTELRYTRGGVLFDEPTQTSDVDRHRVEFSAASGRRSPILTWNFDYFYDKDDRENGDDFEEQEAEGIARYRVSREFRLLALAGHTESDFSSSRNREDGTYWSIGAGWRPSRFFAIEGGAGENNEFVTIDFDPSRRTSLRVGYRDRSVGSDPGVSWDGLFQHRTRRLRFGARYFEETTTTQRLLFDQPIFEVIDPFGDPVEPTGEPITAANGLPTLTDEVFVRERFELFGTTRLGKKGSLNLRLFEERRRFEDAADDEQVVGGRAAWNWRWRRRTSVLATLDLEHTDFRQSSGEDQVDDGIVGLFLLHRFGPDLNGSVGYRFRRRDSSSNADSFDENRLEARLTKTF